MTNPPHIRIEGKTKEILWWNTAMDKPHFQDILMLIQKHFPDMSPNDIVFKSGIMSLSIIGPCQPDIKPATPS